MKYKYKIQIIKRPDFTSHDIYDKKILSHVENEIENFQLKNPNARLISIGPGVWEGGTLFWEIPYGKKSK